MSKFDFSDIAKLFKGLKYGDEIATATAKRFFREFADDLAKISENPKASLDDLFERIKNDEVMDAASKAVLSSKEFRHGFENLVALNRYYDEFRDLGQAASLEDIANLSKKYGLSETDKAVKSTTRLVNRRTRVLEQQVNDALKNSDVTLEAKIPVGAAVGAESAEASAGTSRASARGGSAHAHPEAPRADGDGLPDDDITWMQETLDAPTAKLDETADATKNADAETSTGGASQKNKQKGTPEQKTDNGDGNNNNDGSGDGDGGGGGDRGDGSNNDGKGPDDGNNNDGASGATPDGSPVASSSIILEPKRTLWHQFFRFNPFQRINEKLTFAEGGVSTLWRNLPMRLLSRKHIRSVVNYIDDAVKSSNLAKPILELDADLVKLRKQLASAGSESDKTRILNEANNLVKEFAANNSSKFETLQTQVKAIQAELDVYKPVGYGDGLAGLDTGQINGLKKWMEHLNRLCDSTTSPEDLVKQYNINRGKFVDVGKEAPGITGGMQHYLKLALDSELRIATRNNMGWKPRFQRGWPFINLLGSQIQDVKTVGKGLPGARGRAGPNPAYLSRTIDGGEDGILASDISKGSRFSSHYTADAQNVQGLERNLNDGYFNDEIRTRTIDFNPNGPDNTEQYGIRIRMFYDKYKNPETGMLDRKEELSEALSAMMEKGYNAGRDGDILEAARRLNWQQGVDGGTVTLPDELISTMRQLKPGDANWNRFVDSVEVIIQAEHSPELYAQRWVNKVAEKYTRYIYDGRIAPFTNYSGTPGKNHFIRTPFSRAWKRAWSAVSGGHVVDNIDPTTKLPFAEKPTKIEYRWMSWGDAPEGAGRLARTWNFMNNGPILTNILFRPITIPLSVTGAVVKSTVGAITKHTYKTGLVVGGLAALEGMVEKALPEDTWITDEDGNIVIAGHHLDVGSRVIGGGLYATSYLTAPLRMAARGVNNLTLGSEWVNDAINMVDPEHLVKYNERWTGDRGNAAEDILTWLNSKPSLGVVSSTLLVKAQAELETRSKAAKDARKESKRLAGILDDREDELADNPASRTTKAETLRASIKKDEENLTAADEKLNKAQESLNELTDSLESVMAEHETLVEQKGLRKDYGKEKSGRGLKTERKEELDELLDDVEADIKAQKTELKIAAEALGVILGMKAEALTPEATPDETNPNSPIAPIPKIPAVLLGGAGTPAAGGGAGTPGVSGTPAGGGGAPPAVLTEEEKKKKVKVEAEKVKAEKAKAEKAEKKDKDDPKKKKSDDKMTWDEHIAEAANNGLDGFSKLVAVDSDDKVTQSFNHTVKGIAGGIKKGFGVVAGAFKTMSKDDEGKAWLGLGGGLLGAMMSMKLLDGFWTKFDGIVGKVPILGPLLGVVVKLGAFAALFMAARKGTHAAFNHFGQGDGSHTDPEQLREGDEDGDGEGDSEGGEKPSTKAPVGVKLQTHTASGVPKSIMFIDELDDADFHGGADYFPNMKLVDIEDAARPDHYAVQLFTGKDASGQATYAPVSITGGTDNMIHIPEDMLAKIQANKPTFDAVDHDATKDGKMDAIKLTMDGKEFRIDLPESIKNEHDVLQIQ